MEEEPDRGGDPEQDAGGSRCFPSFLTMCALQLEEELRAVLREQRERSKRNEMRINFRRVQKIKKEAEAGERLREKQVECLERLSRMEGLRRLARRRIGLHLMPKDTRWVNNINSSVPANPKPSSNRIVQLTAAAEGKIKREGTKQPRQMHDPLFPINCWTDEEVKMISGDHFLFCCFVFL